MSAAGVQVEAVVEIAKAAGVAIMEVYEREYEIIEKADGSPVTTADHRAVSYTHLTLPTIYSV